MTHNNYLIFFLGVSIFGLAVVMMSTFYPNVVADDPELRKPLLGSLFVLACLLGMGATAFPKSCFRIFSEGKNRKATDNKYKKSAGITPNFRGHHPNCGNFSHHVFRIGKRPICAGCLGLFIGGLVNLIGAFAYFFAGLRLESSAVPISWIGAAGVSLGLLLPLFSIRWTLGRSAVNAFFAVGVFLVLVGVDSITRDINMGLLLILLTVFWIFTRISISQWSHQRICRRCQLEKCGLRGF